MSLKGFHLVFITCSALLALGTAAWAVMTPDGWGRTLVAAGSIAVLLGLVPYAVWFRRKMREIEDPKSRFTVLLAIVTAGFLAPAAAQACSVCWGSDSGSSWIDASNALFAFMLVLTYGLLGGGVLAFVRVRRRHRRLDDGEGATGDGRAPGPAPRTDPTSGEESS